MNLKEWIKPAGAMTTLLFLSTVLLGIPFAFLLCWYWPVTNVAVRCATILFGLLTIGCVLFATRHHRKLRIVIAAVFTVAFIFLALPARSPQDCTALRDAYVNALQSYLGCPYVWGGEGRFGIDCSGLIRRSMEDALVQQGILHANPFLVRTGILLWWNDTTAREMGRGYGGRMRVVTTCRKLNELDHSLLQPGDLAVTTSGVHVMAYLRNKQWIAADPAYDKVVTFTVPENGNSYFQVPMTIVRWRLLEGASSSTP